MSSAGTKKPEPQLPRPKNPAILMFKTAADTSWRMFLPIIGLTVLGLLIDKKLGTTPWLMIIFMGLGIWLATVLVLRQVRAVAGKKKL